MTKVNEMIQMSTYKCTTLVISTQISAVIVHKGLKSSRYTDIHHASCSFVTILYYDKERFYFDAWCRRITES